jgi:cytochrome c biogenesis protein CcdA
MEQIKPDYPSLNIIEYEIYANSANRKIAEAFATAYGQEISGIPAVFIDGKMIVGFNDAIGVTLKQEIDRCVAEGCESPLDRLKQAEAQGIVHIETESSPANPGKDSALKRLTLPAVITGALVDSINPCEFAVLIILLTTILAAGGRKRALFAGLAFAAAIYISYFLMGLGLFSAIAASGLTRTFYIVMAFVAIIVGVFNLKDYFWYGRWFKMEVPDSWRPKMKMLLKSVTSVPGAFLIGIVISLFLLPCTSGPYIVILGLLAESTTRAGAIPLLLLYNLIFILPMLIITFAIYFGITTTEKAEEWRTRKLKVLHLIAGVVIILIGIGMFVALALGYV